MADQASRKTKPPSSARTWAKALTPAQLREAERGFKQILARKFSARWIAENHRDLLAQANAEYVEWLEENEPARNPVGWILNCAYWRAQNLLDSETRKPRPAPLDSVFHVADEKTPDPEQQALDRDRKRRLGEALSRLPEKEQRLLSLVYYDGLSIREAGRKLGWQKSAADRHHAAAMEKMLALVGDRSLLSPAVLGLLAQQAISSHSSLSGLWNVAATPCRFAWATIAEAAELSARRAFDAAHRLAPFTDAAGSTAASTGAGRALAQCAAAAGIAACGVLAAPSIEGGVNDLLRGAGPPRSRPASSPPSSRSTTPESSTPAASESARARESELSSPKPRRPRRRPSPQRRAAPPHRKPAPAPVAPAPAEPAPEPPPAEEAPPPPPPPSGGSEFSL